MLKTYENILEKDKVLKEEQLDDVKTVPEKKGASIYSQSNS